MAIDKLYGAIDDISSAISRTLLEDTIAKFDAQLATCDRKSLRDKLRSRLANIEININGDKTEDISTFI